MSKQGGGTLARVLRDHSDEVLERWAARVCAQQECYGEMSREALLNRLPEWMARLADGLADSENTDVDTLIEPEMSRSHGYLRFTQNIPLGLLIQEYITLRETLLSQVQQYIVLNERHRTLLACCTDRALVEATQAFARQGGEARASLEAQKHQTEYILNIANVGLWTWNPENDTAYLSPQAKAQLGYEDDEIGDSPLAWHTLILDEDRHWVKQLLDDVAHFRREEYQAEFRARHKDGSIRWILSRGGWWPPDDNRDAWLLVGINIDISNRKRVEKALLKEKRRAQVTLSSISEGVITTDGNGIVQQLNPAAESSIGWSEQQATGQHCRQIFQVVDDRDGRRLESPIMECLRLNQTVSRKFHTRLLTRTGVSHPIAYSVSPIIDPDGGASGAVMVYFDVSEERRLLREMTHQASHDELTGLANRREFETRLGKAVGQASAGSEAALMFIDLDRFKAINDTCGHTAGDRLLKDVAKMLQEPIRDRDTLARIGGDEFAVILEHCSLENARDIALQLRERVRGYRFTCAGHTFELGVSIGITAIDQSTSNAAGVVSRADAACSHAKSKGRNRVEVYRPSQPDPEREHTQMRWLPALQQALAADSFRLFRQPFEPVLAATEGLGPLYFEILLRFQNEQGEIIPAQSFISAAERHELMPAVDLWVVQHTFDWLTAHPGISDRLGLCCINLSAALLGDENAHPALLVLLDRWAIQPQKICFEIDESEIGAHREVAYPLIRQIRAHGYRFALDHFGRGVSSFDLLKELPLDYVKIDRRYIERVAIDSDDQAIVRSINDMSHAMGLQTIAEGVNSFETRQTLALIGVDFMQGFSVGRPQDVATMPADL